MISDRIIERPVLQVRLRAGRVRPEALVAKISRLIPAIT
jgi:hypothetical protein